MKHRGSPAGAPSVPFPGDRPVDGGHRSRSFFRRVVHINGTSLRYGGRGRPLPYGSPEALPGLGLPPRRTSEKGICEILDGRVTDPPLRRIRKPFPFFVGAGPRPARWLMDKFPRCGGRGKPLLYSSTESVLDWGGEALGKYRWFGRARRGSGTVPAANFTNPGPQWARKETHPSTPGFARRKHC